ncbi:MAG TPA: hypothetical protein VFX69_03490 [Steroidobacteraceae bacterium]|nr:hypothetical protein [Steroidobacteraceae bacterium]
MPGIATTPARPHRLGLRENVAQFSLLVAVNALVGGMIGQERTVLPLLAMRTFHLTAFTATLTFIVAFGTVKAATNFRAGTLSDRPERRGLAMGFNEAADCVAVAVTALVTGVIAQNAGLRPEPFFLGITYAALGLGLSAIFVREPHGHAHFEARSLSGPSVDSRLPSTREVFVLTSLREKALSSCSQAGLVNSLNDGLAWGLFPAS